MRDAMSRPLLEAGVKTVEIKQADQMAPFLATVAFDYEVTNVFALVAAPTNAG